jgi:prepilin signal peptidase PulO-like enzyme (type II secretory pathway)
MVVAFFICAAFYELKFWGGGDVKLIAMVASFLGWLFLPILVISVLLIKAYKKIFKVNNGIPVAPFVCVASVPFLLFNIPAILR